MALEQLTVTSYLRSERSDNDTFWKRRVIRCGRAAVYEDQSVPCFAMTEPPQRPQPEMTTAAGPWGGPVYRHRGAEIRCAKGGHVCSLFMEGHRLHGSSFGVAGTITPLIDAWLDKGRLPSYMRAVPKTAAGAGR